MNLRRISFFISILILLSSFCGCKSINKELKSQIYYGLFDSYVEISSYNGDSEDTFNNNCKSAYEKLQYYNKLFDIYNEYEGVKNLCSVNKEAGKSPVVVDMELIEFVEYAIDICKKCDLEINIAMGAVLELWHDARVSANEYNKPYLPSKNDLENAVAHSDINSIVIDRENSTIFISDPMVKIDVGAIAKGYAAMKIEKLLSSRGADGYIVNLGGNIVAIGTKSNGDGWVTGITNPDKNSDESFAAKIEISNISCVTSGDYERYFTFNGKDYHHIIDKDTLAPATYYRSVTVLCPDSTLADALSTALFCMPLEEGKKLLDAFPNTDAIWIFADGSIYKTDGIDLLAQ